MINNKKAGIIAIAFLIIIFIGLLILYSWFNRNNSGASSVFSNIFIITLMIITTFFIIKSVLSGFFPKSRISTFFENFYDSLLEGLRGIR